MGKNKKKNKKKNVFGSDLNCNGNSNKVSKRLRKLTGGLTPLELNSLVSKIKPSENKITILSSTRY